tara:strand:+ start:84 stop:293 length:210 start_codon:yes stop_codon:yes gene_type:complete
MKRYTQSNNTRFEKSVDDRLTEIVQTDSFCIKNNYSKSDLVRQLLRMGLKQYEYNLSERIKVQNGERYG